MRTKLTILAGILACGASLPLQAATSYLLDFNTTSNTPGLVYDGAYVISPFTGTVNGTSVELYCVDFNDSIAFGQQNISVYSTALTANTTALTTQTRYGVDNPSSNSTYPSGITLYEEMAWLATQMRNTSSTTQDKALQEAIWQLTDAPGGSSAPNNSSGNSGTAYSGLSGTSQSAAKWIQDAKDYIAGFNASTGTSSWSLAYKYEDLVLSNWYIITATNSAGCTTGNNGSTGCTPGTAGTHSGATQEFLAYKNGGLVTSTPNTSPAVPEPATFVLIGSGLLAGVVLKRRKA